MPILLRSRYRYYPCLENVRREAYPLVFSTKRSNVILGTAKLFVKNYREKEIFFFFLKIARPRTSVTMIMGIRPTHRCCMHIYIYLWSRDNNDSGNKLSLAATASTIFTIMTIINWWTTARRTDRLLLLERI